MGMLAPFLDCPEDDGNIDDSCEDDANCSKHENDPNETRYTRRTGKQKAK
jgi:hypothetical protein